MELPVIKLTYQHIDEITRILTRVYFDDPVARSNLILTNGFRRNGYRYFREVAKAHLDRKNPILGAFMGDRLIGVALLKMPNQANKKINTLL